MKNRGKSVFSELQKTSNWSDEFISKFTWAHQMRKYAYWIKQNAFNRFHILI